MEKQLSAILDANKKQVPVTDRGTKDGDFVTYKYQSKNLKTKKMTPRKEGSLLMEKDNNFEILDFYQEILTKKPGEKTTFTRKYPKDYKKKIWAGHEIEHSVELLTISQYLKPELDKEFLSKMGFEDEDKFKEKLKEEYEKRQEKQIEEIKFGKIIEELGNSIDFPVPQSLAHQEMQKMASQNEYLLRMGNKEQQEKYIETLKDNSNRSVKISLIIEKLKDANNIKVTSDDLEKEYKEIAQNNNLNVKDVRKYYLNKDQQQQLKDAMLRVKVMDFLKEKIKVKEV